MTELSLKAMQTALRKTTEALATELASPTAIAPDWSETEWLVARAVSAIHGVSALLANKLRWQGPPGWAEFLADQKAHTAKRFVRVQHLLHLIDSRARNEGIALVALKGAALHASGIYTAGERPMSDIDLLVRDEQSQGAVQLIEALGFHESHATWKHRVFKPENCATPAKLGEHADNGITIELHTRIAEILPLRPVDVSELVFPRQPHPGLNDYPSKAGLLIHVLLHASGAMITRGVRLLHLQDVARLSVSMTEADWEEVFRQAATTDDQTLWWAYPPLALASRYYSCVPDPVLARAASGCRWLLKRIYRRRTLSDVSLSHLWISAFPGIEWARSLREMLAYAAERVVPSAETRCSRKVFATVQPRVSGGPWAQMSQSRRMLRWAMSRQARHETVQPVRAALSAAH
jgi:putative nucleotidyltransferase-like protein